MMGSGSLIESFTHMHQTPIQHKDCNGKIILIFLPGTRGPLGLCLPCPRRCYVTVCVVQASRRLMRQLMQTRAATSADGDSCSDDDDDASDDEDEDEDASGGNGAKSAADAVTDTMSSE